MKPAGNASQASSTGAKTVIGLLSRKSLANWARTTAEAIVLSVGVRTNRSGTVVRPGGNNTDSVT